MIEVFINLNIPLNSHKPLYSIDDVMSLLGNSKIYIRLSLWMYKLFLDQNEINYLKLAFPDLEMFYEGCTLKNLMIRGYPNIVLPKNMNLETLDIYNSNIEFVDPSIKVEEIWCNKLQLYHFPLLYDKTDDRFYLPIGYNTTYPFKIKDYDEQYKILMQSDKKKYLENISNICERLRTNHD